LAKVLHIRVQRILQSDNGLGAFECTIKSADQVDGAELASATVTVFQPDNATEFLNNTSE
jgi:predicted hotdog family 3-hydroxylacyl-ACP dehydratase